MDEADIRARLSTCAWHDVRVLERTASTNADVAAAARDGAPEGLVVATLDQRSGRGRLDRSWQCPPGAGLAVSVLLRPDQVVAARWPWLPLLSGVAVRAAVREVTGLDATLKWPNDVLVAGRKLAGILLERVDGGPGPAAVVGIGINVAMTREQLPVPDATSLALEGVVVDPTELLVALLTVLGTRYDHWCGAGGDPEAGLATEYAEACSTLGTRVRVRLCDGAEVAGVATGIDADGRLRMHTEAGTFMVGAGDVVHLRGRS